MIKGSAIISVFLAIVLFAASPAAAADPPVIDSQYIKEHYPEVYQKIYREGKESGRKEAEEGIKKAVSGGAVPAAAAPGPAVQAGPDLAAWWQKNSLKYAPLPEQWLFHVEGTLDFKHKTGNTRSDLYNGSASFMVRKLQFTNTLAYIINKELTTQLPTPGNAVSKTDNDYRSFQESLRYDLTDRLYAEGGYMWERDKANFISNRNIYYGGAGYTLIDAGRHHLDVFVAAGYQAEEYPEAVRTAMNMEREKVTAAYLREEYRWNVTDRFTYKQTFRFVQNLKRSNVFNDDLSNLRIIDETRRYRWFIINEIYYKIAAHLNFMTGYKIEYDSNPWPTVLKRDSTIKSGFQFSF